MASLRETKMQVQIKLLTFLLLSGLATYAAPIPQAPSIAANGYILMDASTGEVLSELNGDELLPPASLTKIMTSYVAAVEIKEGRIEAGRPSADQYQGVAHTRIKNVY